MFLPHFYLAGYSPGVMAALLLNDWCARARVRGEDESANPLARAVPDPPNDTPETATC